MKRFFLIAPLVALMLLACKKEDELPDDILFVNLNPDLVLSPAKSFSNHPSSLCQEIIPSPADSSVSQDIDLNQDGVNDFRFTYTTSYKFVSASSPCVNYNSRVDVAGLGSGNKVMVANTDRNEVKVLAMGTSINEDQVFADAAVLYRDAANAFLYFGGFSGDGYIGLRLANGSFGWVKVNFSKDTFTCTVLEHGYNKISKSDITAGQLE